MSSHASILIHGMASASALNNLMTKLDYFEDQNYGNIW